MPPIMGAAIRFITSAPVPVDHMMGINPSDMVATVMNLGRMRLAAPLRMASAQISQTVKAVFLLGLFVRQIQV